MDNKTKILEVALELFSLKGYDGTGIQEIVEKSAIGKPTMYYYFGNKEGVLQAIHEKYFDSLNSMIDKATLYAGDITKSLNELASGYFNFALKNKTFFKMMLSMSCQPVETQAYKISFSFLQRKYHLINGLFTKAEKDHGNMKGRSFLFTVSFIGILNTYATMVINENVVLDDALPYKVVHQFMHGIFS